MTTIKQSGLLVLVLTLPFTVGADQQMVRRDHERTWTGTLTSVNARNGVVAGKWWLFTKTFNVGDQCSISAMDKEPASLSDLRPGEKVKIRYQDVEGVRVADRIAERPLHYRGTVEKVDRQNGTVTIEEKAMYRTFSSHETFRTAGDCRVIRWNGKDGTLDDVRPGDKVAVIYELPGGSPVAYRIKERSSTFVGTVDGIDLSDRTVKAKDMFGNKKFNLADGCRIIVPGQQTGHLRDLGLGQKFKFTYEDVNGVNVVVRIAPTEEGKSAETASTR